MGKSVMIGRIFAGDKTLFQEAVDNNEVYYDSDDEAWFYDSKQKKVKEAQSDGAIGKMTFTMEEKDKFLTALSNCATDIAEIEDSKWVNKIRKQKGPKAITDGPATDGDMVLLQESFDAVSSTTTGR